MISMLLFQHVCKFVKFFFLSFFFFLTTSTGVPYREDCLNPYASRFESFINYPLSYGVPVRERYGSTLLPATREQHDQNCTQSH